jgi:hypothetical protein
MTKEKEYEFPSLSEQLESCLKAAKEGKLIKWDGTNL